MRIKQCAAVLALMSICQVAWSDVYMAPAPGAGETRDIEFAQDGVFLVAMVGPWTVHVWNQQSGQLVGIVQIPDPMPESSSLNPFHIVGCDIDESQDELVVETPDGQLIASDIFGNVPPKYITHLSGEVNMTYGHYLRFGRYVQYASSDRGMYVVSRHTGLMTYVQMPFSTSGVNYAFNWPKLIFPQDGRYVITCCAGSLAGVWKADLSSEGYTDFSPLIPIDTSPGMLRQNQDELVPESAVVSRNGTEIAAIGRRANYLRGPVEIQVWNEETGKTLDIDYSQPGGDDDIVRSSVVLSDDGRLVAFRNTECNVFAYSTSSGQLLAHLSAKGLSNIAAKAVGYKPIDSAGHAIGYMGDLAISTDDRFVAIAVPGTVLLWNIVTAQAHLLPNHKAIGSD